MSELWMRDAAPFGEDVWHEIDEMAITVMKKILVGRQFLDLVGPLGWGVEQAPVFGFETEGAAVAKGAEYIKLQELGEEFLLRAKHLAMAQDTPFKLDLGAVAIAATNLARQEDEMILQELMAKAKIQGALGDWNEPNGPFSAVAQGIATLQDHGVSGPYAMVLGPMMYARLASLMHGKGFGRRELDMVQSLLGEGLYVTTRMPDGKALLISPQSWNMDLVVGQDAVVAYLGNEGIDHRFRLFETLALRVKRPEAICVLQ
ncbi:MAG: encapsulin [Chloroflexi bacterium]|nr:encapsulin [Chloroflexota bacterium]